MIGLRRTALLAALLLAVPAHGADFVNLVRLLGDGSRYAHSEVMVSGYVCESPASRDGLFLTLQDCKDANYDNAVRLENRAVIRTRRGLVELTGVYEFKEGVIATDETYRWGSLTVSYEH
jgi:hypothetical protein